MRHLPRLLHFLRTSSHGKQFCHSNPKAAQEDVAISDCHLLGYAVDAIISVSIVGNRLEHCLDAGISYTYNLSDHIG